MKNTKSIGILTFQGKDESYTAKRLKEEAEKYSPKVSVEKIYVEKTSLSVDENGKLTLHYPKPGFNIPHLILTKLAAVSPSYGLYVLNHLSNSAAYKVINKIEGVAVSRDKFRTLQILGKYGFKVPKSVSVGELTDLNFALKQVGGFPAIMKLNKGTWGIGVMIVESPAGARSVFEALTKLGQRVIVQEYLSSEPGVDYRVYVLGDKVLGSMKRTAQIKGEFRANIAKGAKGEKFNAPKSLEHLAIRIAKTVGLDIAGVDFVYSDRYGYVPIEVNSSPGIKGLEKAAGKNIAKEILKYCLKR